MTKYFLCLLLILMISVCQVDCECAPRLIYLLCVANISNLLTCNLLIYLQIDHHRIAGAYWTPQTHRYIWGWGLESGLVWGCTLQSFNILPYIWPFHGCYHMFWEDTTPIFWFVVFNSFLIWVRLNKISSIKLNLVKTY